MSRELLPRTQLRWLLAVVGRLGPVLLAALVGCRTAGPAAQRLDVALTNTPALVEQALLPSNQRNWSPDQAVLPYAVFNGDRVTIHNVRNCTYQSDTDYVVNHYDKTYDLNRLESVDFLVAPFTGSPKLAHTMMSFGFSDGDHLGVSVEARLEDGETYSPILGSLRQFELMYVLADERDLIVRRTRFRATDVYLYRTVATPMQAREMFVDVMDRVNKLYTEPEFYDTLTNNCTTNIAVHVNRLRSGRVPYELRVLLPGLSDQLAYELGLLRTDSSFEETKRRAKITSLANQHADSRDFSDRIRR